MTCLQHKAAFTNQVNKDCYKVTISDLRIQPRLSFAEKCSQVLCCAQFNICLFLAKTFCFFLKFSLYVSRGNIYSIRTSQSHLWSPPKVKLRERTFREVVRLHTCGRICRLGGFFLAASLRKLTHFLCLSVSSIPMLLSSSYYDRKSKDCFDFDYSMGYIYCSTLKATVAWSIYS